MRRRWGAALALAVLASAVGIGVARPAAAAGGQVLLADTFANPTTSSPVLPLTASPGVPCLTAGTDPSATPIPACTGPADPLGAGVLRLTELGANQLGGIVYGTDFPLAQGLRVQFKVYQWGGAVGADGVLFALAAAPPRPTQLGPPGGFLGYGTDGPAGTGLPAGYLGFGLDSYGSFADMTNEVASCPDPAGRPNPGLWPNAISVRGPGNGTVGYCLLTSSAFPAAQPTFFHAGSRAGSKSGIEIVVDPDAGTYTVGFDVSGGESYTTVTSGPLPAAWYDQAGVLQPGRPDRVTFVFTGGTGTFDDYHEIGELTAVTLNGSVPVLALDVADDSGGATVPGGTFGYVLRPRVTADGGDETEPETLVLSATLPANTTLAATPTGTNWDCSASAGTSVSCTYANPDTVPAGTDLPPVSVPVLVAAGASIGDSLDLLASITSADAAQPVAASGSVAVGIAPPPGPVPDESPNGGTGGGDATGSRHRSTPADNPTATTAQPSVSTPCSGTCTLAARTRDTDVEIVATDTAFGGASTTEDPTFFLAINGGGGEPRCPGYRNADRDWVQFGFRDDAGPTFEKTARVSTRRALSEKAAQRLLARRQVCFEAPYRFATRPGFAAGRNGIAFVGVLPDCSAAGRGPCVSSRKVVRVGSGWGVRIVFVVPPNKRDPKALG